MASVAVAVLGAEGRAVEQTVVASAAKASAVVVGVETLAAPSGVADSADKASAGEEVMDSGTTVVALRKDSAAIEERAAEPKVLVVDVERAPLATPEETRSTIQVSRS